MNLCPQCRYSVASGVAQCPRCGLALQAYGHPGLPISYAQEGVPLCLSCVYHADDSCTFPHRPEALDCVLYRDHTPESEIDPRAGRLGRSGRLWGSRMGGRGQRASRSTIVLYGAIGGAAFLAVVLVWHLR
jgi:hypothetical protein